MQYKIMQNGISKNFQKVFYIEIRLFNIKLNDLKFAFKQIWTVDLETRMLSTDHLGVFFAVNAKVLPVLSEFYVQ